MNDKVIGLLCSDRELPEALFDNQRHQTWGRRSRDDDFITTQYYANLCGRRF